MIAGERHEADWDHVEWTRVTFWLMAAASGVGVIAALIQARPGAAIGAVILGAAAVAAAQLLKRRDDRGWWLALGVVGAVVLYGIVMAIVDWAIMWVIGNWLAFVTLWALRHPPPFPWNKQSRATSF